MAGFVGTANLANAAATLYESFDYAAGGIDGSQDDGTGFAAGGWSTSAQASGNPVYEVAGGLSFTGLSTAGRAVKRTGNSGGAEMNRGISGASQTTLTANDTSIWFTVLMAATSTTGHRNSTMALTTGAFTDGGDNGDAPGIAGDGFGVGYSKPSVIRGWSSVAGVEAHTGSLTVDPNNGTHLIAGRIDWTSGVDTMTLYDITNLSVLPTSFATVTASIDQTQLNTIAIFDRQQTYVDEIRFGLTSADVGLTLVPEPSSTALLGLGGLTLILRRRR